MDGSQKISVVNLEKYQPNYKDGRKLLWIRWDVAALGDYKITKLPPEGKWLFIVLICLATDHNNLVPNDFDWLSHQSGIDKKHISKLLDKLQELKMVVTTCDKMSQDVTYIHTDNTYNTIHTDKPIEIKIPPLLEEVANYCKERGNRVDANKWFDFYQSKGWMIGKSKMKDWRAAIRTWEAKSGERGQGNRINSKPGKYANIGTTI